MANTDNILDEILNDEDTHNFEYLKENEILDPLLAEIDLIKDHHLRNFVRSLLLKSGPFWYIPASFTGEYHPPDERDESGNVLHTKRVVRVATLLSDAYQLGEEARDILVAAALVHDITKGVIWDVSEGPSYDPLHPYTVDRFVRMARAEDKQYTSEAQSSCLFVEEETVQAVLRLVRCHMGVWSPIPETFPDDAYEMMLHIADNVAAHLHWIIDGEEVDDHLWRWVQPVQE